MSDPSRIAEGSRRHSQGEFLHSAENLLLQDPLDARHQPLLTSTGANLDVVVEINIDIARPLLALQGGRRH
jgi:hypothetical protein